MGNLRLISMMHTPWRTDAFLYNRYLDLEGKNSQLICLPCRHATKGIAIAFISNSSSVRHRLIFTSR